MEQPKEKFVCCSTSTINLVSTLPKLIEKSARRMVTKFAMFVQLSVGSRHSLKKETN
ncbi:hypothetical protein KIN20_012715 [Parelaphostrongylus tenuis]|uniref:Uncharacterized protein n=1 Tax=Parelaphostrongylus tenuis TaxID=148309 RepID=A0AAD5MXA5_PARTN|nr:hypothetical protein KIN20_012715 [Parelaphostrongylus tenuis]